MLCNLTGILRWAEIEEGFKLVAKVFGALFSLFWTSVLEQRHLFHDRINAKLHEGVCQHCKEVLEWRVKYSKYKPLSKPKKWISNRLEKTADVESDEISNSRRRNGRLEEQSSDELDFDLDLNESEDEEQTNPNSYTKNKSASAKT
ncbi:uncharacterized protein C9orf85 homolog isoform X3 [Monodelphis domestica]|uniref:uncharacterized protein C9orf85 homolog isoform X3 n=1 Tax=Monodelphis domestica TaxID=13616 RepID=UPI0024E218C1|nr:uncharacterized protein C9orf85 homolog isoform X3 [Monodelphis domestica]